MNYLEFLDKLEASSKRELPGQLAQHKMVPAERQKTDLSSAPIKEAKKAAVAALFYEKETQPHLILTKRSEYPGVHSGQISFPGGRKEDTDKDYRETAIRETEEEIGISSNIIEIKRELTPLYIPPSNFFVRPFLGLLNKEPEFQREEKEVNEIFSIDFNRLLDDRSIVTQTLKARSYNITVPTFLVDGYTIWGATAMMISEIRDIFTQQKIT